MSAPDRDFSELARAGLAMRLAGLPPVRRLIVAFSGGLDSSSLLHALATAQPPPAELLAVHVDHGLHPISAAWAGHCAEACRALGVEFMVERLAGQPPAGASLEAWARTARYAAIARVVRAGDVVLTAHHQDDQAETFLLQALRGAGPHGLSGIAPCRTLGDGWLVRPLLGVPRAAIRAYATRHRLAWIEDPSNSDPTRERNWLRAAILPALARRRASHAANLARVAALQAEAAVALDALADGLLGPHHAVERELPLAIVRGLTPVLQRLVLRRWLVRGGAPSPDQRQLTALVSSVLAASESRTVDFRYKGWRVRRYRDRLFLARVGPILATPAATAWPDLATPLAWRGGELRARAVSGHGLRATAVPASGLTVHPRHGGERCRPDGRAHSQTLKRLLQARGVPPWQRAVLPMLYAGEHLVAVADLWICAPFAARGDEVGWEFEWAAPKAAE